MERRLDTICTIAENKKYTRSSAGSALSSASQRTTSTVASSAPSSQSKIRRYLTDAVTTVQNINSQLFSAGDEFSVDELRQQLQHVSKAGYQVRSRADDYSLALLNDFLKELATLQECVGRLPQETQAQVAYNLGLISAIAAAITEVSTAKTSTHSLAGSYATLQQQQNSERLARLEELVVALSAQLKSQNASKEEDSAVEDMDAQRAIQPLAPANGVVAVPALHWNAQQFAEWQAAMAGRHARQPPNFHNDNVMYFYPAGAVMGNPQAFPGLDGAAPMNGQPAIVINNNAHAHANARQHNSQLSSLVNSVKLKLRQTLGNPLVSAAVGAVTMLLLHNRVPVLNRIAPRRDTEEGARAAQVRTKRLHQVSRAAVEDCYDALEAMRSHSRRARPLIGALPEPDTSKCDLRAVLRRLDATAAVYNDEGWTGVP